MTSSAREGLGDREPERFRSLKVRPGLGESLADRGGDSAGSAGPVRPLWGDHDLDEPRRASGQPRGLTHGVVCHFLSPPSDTPARP
jgi:hypothetical protein